MIECSWNGWWDADATSLRKGVDASSLLKGCKGSCRSWQ
jgi:hypothetical protein